MASGEAAGVRGGSRRGGAAPPRWRPARCPPSPSPRPRCGGSPTSRWCPGCCSYGPRPRGRRAALDGWLGGVGFMIAVHHWLLPSLHVFIVVLAALLGLLWAPWGWLVRRLLGGTPSRGPRGRGPGRRPLGLADDRTGPVLGGAGRAVGAARGEPVAGAAPPCGSPRWAGCGWSACWCVAVNTAIDRAGRGGARRRTRRGGRASWCARHRAVRPGPGPRGPSRSGRCADRGRPAGRRRRRRQRRAPLRPRARS